MDAADFFIEVIGVSNDDDAVLAARGMIERGVQVIELCVVFGSEIAEYIISQFNSHFKPTASAWQFLFELGQVFVVVCLIDFGL